MRSRVASARGTATASLHLVVADNLRRAQARKRVSMEDLSQKSGLTLKLLAGILEGKPGKLYMRRLKAIADALEMDYADLVKRRASKDA